ncbi:MAG: hypothetical protein PW735_02620 [Acidobacteriaceae bacterium]|nr:hypothetical protein [Acidobacteriaceae bacterium]
MKSIHLTAAIVLSVFALSLHAQEGDWEKRLNDRMEAAVKANGNGTNPTLRAELLEMGKQDQDARFKNTKEATSSHTTDAHELSELDAKLTAQLKEIVASDGWPTFHLVGFEASQSAMLILIHSPDHAWQRSLLPSLETLANEGKIDGSQVALVVDKELVAAGKPQRYGTQFKFIDGEAMMVAVEDPANLDKRRDKEMLPPMAAYKQQLASMYHIKVSNMIIAPQAAATPTNTHTAKH